MVITRSLGVLSREREREQAAVAELVNEDEIPDEHDPVCRYLPHLGLP